MTEAQWQLLLSVIDGDRHQPPPVGFISDSPWLPGWAGMSILDYYTNERLWMEANLKQIRHFPGVLFLPGFWAEYGMCTEPSAFGAKCTWAEDEFPFAHRLSGTLDDIVAMDCPDPRKDGLPPFVLKRLQHCLPAIEETGHSVRFAIARGPWNIAAFLLGTTEFMMALHMQPDKVHALLNMITEFLVDWLQVQAAAFPTTDGVFILDDIVGFVGKKDLVEFGVPYFKRVFHAIDASVRFFHNDSKGLVCAPFLHEMGVNLFNFSYEHGIQEMKHLTENRVTLLGNVPPRDVLAAGTPDDVRQAVHASLKGVTDLSRIILSCGGGLPPGVPTENLEAFIDAAKVRRPAVRAEIAQ